MKHPFIPGSGSDGPRPPSQQERAAPIQRESDPLRELAIAVMAVALTDAALHVHDEPPLLPAGASRAEQLLRNSQRAAWKRAQDARLWLQTDSEVLRHWCDAVELEVDVILRIARQRWGGNRGSRNPPVAHS
jgi:hypothetical protein